MRRLISALGHLAIWVGLYVAGVVGAFGLLSGAPVRWAHLAAAFCTGMGVYLIDRVKLRDAWLDRADAESHPERHGFLARRVGLVRAIAAVLGVVAGGIAWTLHPIGVVLVVLSFMGVVVYAGLPRERYRPARRPKDVFILKNLAVALSMTLFAFVLLYLEYARDLAAAWEQMLSDRLGLVLAVLLVCGHVFADAVLCDLDDREADARFGTSTLANRVGRSAPMVLAICVGVVALIVSLLVGDSRNTVVFNALMLATLVPLVGIARVRDLVDLRLPVCVLVAWLL